MRSQVKTIVAALTLTMLLVSSKPALAQTLAILNNLISSPYYSQDVTIFNNPDYGVGYIPPQGNVNLDIYALDANGIKWEGVGLDTSTNNIVMKKLAYVGSVPSGYTNTLTGYFLDSDDDFSTTSTFPSYILITAKTIAPNAI